MKRPWLYFITGMVFIASICQPVVAQNSIKDGGTLVLSAVEDVYYPLAEKIATNESALLVHTWDEALSLSPSVILWVVAPENLSDQEVIKAGHALRTEPMLPAIGLISGATLNDAQDLWLRGKKVQVDWQQDPPDLFIAANGEHPTAGTDQPQMTFFQTGQSPQTNPMNLDSFKASLQQADYLTFTGHGGDSYLRLDEDTRLEYGSLPNMPTSVLESTSCQTMRPWSGDSIAIDFVGKGVAGYAGFAYSPLAGYMIGGLRDLPFRYSWPGFPIGSIISLENRAAMQGFADFPFLFLLGDPRISMTSSTPFKVVSDNESHGTRLLTFQDAPQGLIPVRVEGGSLYRYVNHVGSADTTDGDPFFNSRIQAASRNGDKYILINHKGGDFSLRLQINPPFYWWPSRFLTAAFDDVALFTPLNGGNWIILFFGLLSLVIASFRWWKVPKLNRTFTRAAFIISISISFGVTLILGLYQLWRLPETTINTKTMAFDPIWLAGVFILTLSGCWLYFWANKWPEKLLAIFFAVSPALIPAISSYLIVSGTNILIAQKIGAPVYNYHMGNLPMIATVVWILCLAIPLESYKTYMNKI